MTTYFILKDPPESPYDAGAERYIAFDHEYLYVYVDGRWKRTALSTIPPNGLSRMIPSIVSEYHVTHDASYFYAFIQRQWRNVGVSMNNAVRLKKEPWRKITQPYGIVDHITSFRFIPPPQNTDTFGQDGNVSYDKEYFYVYIQKEWHRVAISDFINQNLIIPLCHNFL